MASAGGRGGVTTYGFSCCLIQNNLDEAEGGFGKRLSLAVNEPEAAVEGFGGPGDRLGFPLTTPIGPIWPGPEGTSQAGGGESQLKPKTTWSRGREAGIHVGLLRKLGDDFELTLRVVDQMEKTSAGKHRWLVTTLKP